MKLRQAFKIHNAIWNFGLRARQRYQSATARRVLSRIKKFYGIDDHCEFCSTCFDLELMARMRYGQT